jgi:hypothetical protein
MVPARTRLRVNRRLPVAAPAREQPHGTAARPQVPSASIAALMAPRTASELSAAQLAAATGLQRQYGNQAVQRLLAGPRAAGTPAVPATPHGAAPSAGGPAVIQRWHDEDHMDTTRDAMRAVGPRRLAAVFPRFAGDEAGLIERVADASVNMDRFVPHVMDPTKESHNVGRIGSGVAFLGSAAINAIGRGIGNLTGLRTRRSDSRGVVGEGPDHGEAGEYKRLGSSDQNREREDHYIRLAVDALKAGNTDLALNKVGDASHVAADRGSHGEGDRGRGHDTPAPGPRESGTNFPLWMENLNDCDDRSKNPGGYAYGLEKTTAMFERFLSQADRDRQDRADSQHLAEMTRLVTETSPTST